ncbi:hypothetical protein CP980_34725 [Streptomyces vinaceus]|uniref:Uncharacterized protein n=1 Tax=Streptomyces vinaceus TaxID=1960 RepID=A0A5J6JPR3_STRVI|nr:hypothetical protein [Streptomyces vinaceus]QEV49498.1 hypothetical protein CP980_34725 [Streptomyces vinaceus]GHE46155.1 hypothetical protein GCM10017778_32500 [Streptomyces vinaceus]
MRHGLTDQAAAVLGAMADKAPEVFAAVVRALPVITAAHEGGRLPEGASPADSWGDLYDLPVPGIPVLVEFFTGDPESLTITRITWMA